MNDLFFLLPMSVIGAVVWFWLGNCLTEARVIRWRWLANSYEAIMFVNSPISLNFQAHAIAHVGAFKRFSEADQGRVLLCYSWLAERNVALRGHEQDIINLQYKRDFLTENKTYDAVIVHSVFDVHHVSIPSKKGTLVSSQHDLYNWRKRLVATHAKVIFICEGIPATLSGWKIGNLDGYEIAQRDNMVTIYVETLSQAQGSVP